MEASLNIVAALEQDDLHSHSSTTSSSDTSNTGQINETTKKSTCEKINANKKAFEKGLTKTLKEGETKAYKGKLMQAVFTSVKADTLRGWSISLI